MRASSHLSSHVSPAPTMIPFSRHLHKNHFPSSSWYCRHITNFSPQMATNANSFTMPSTKPASRPLSCLSRDATCLNNAINSDSIIRRQSTTPFIMNHFCMASGAHYATSSNNNNNRRHKRSQRTNASSPSPSRPASRKMRHSQRSKSHLRKDSPSGKAHSSQFGGKRNSSFSEKSTKFASHQSNNRTRSTRSRSHNRSSQQAGNQGMMPEDHHKLDLIQHHDQHDDLDYLSIMESLDKKPSAAASSRSKASSLVTKSPSSQQNAHSSTTASGTNWYPFHMSRARHDIQNRHTDCYIQLLDARCPFSSYNPSILYEKPNTSNTPRRNQKRRAHNAPLKKNRSKTKEILSVCYKRDLAQVSPDIASQDLLLKGDLTWLDHFASQSELNRFISRVEGSVQRQFKTIPVVACVVGAPNVGKSSFINLLAQKQKAQKGDLPGVTKRVTGFNVTRDLMILDTPGILTPRIETEEEKMKLMLINAITEKMVDYEELVKFGLHLMNRKGFTSGYMKEYGFDTPCDDAHEFLIEIAKKHSARSGETWDKARAAELWIRKFRTGGFGKVFLDDLPSEITIRDKTFPTFRNEHTQFLGKSVHNLSDWHKHHFEHVYIEADPFVHMSEYTAKLKLLKRQKEVYALLLHLVQAFVEKCSLKRCNLIFGKLNRNLKNLKSTESVMIRDKGKYDSVDQHMMWMANEYAHSETDMQKRLFITNNEETARKVAAQGYKVVHMGEWLDWMARVLFREHDVESMLARQAELSKDNRVV